MKQNPRVLVGLLMVIALILAACGGGEAATTTIGGVDETTTTSGAVEETTSTSASTDTTGTATGEALVIWADERKVEPLQAIAPAFTEATGVEVVVELVPFGEIRDQVSTAGPAGEGPDIFAGAHDWTGELVANGVIDPIDVGAKADSFVQIALNAFVFEGQTYAVPYVTEAIALYYNTDLVPEVPATFDDIAAACETAGVGTCLGMPGGGAATDAYHNYPFVSAFGGSIFAYDPATGIHDPSEVRLDTPEAIQGAEYLATQVDAGVVASTDYDTAKNLFLEGSSAFWITGPWELGTLREQSTINWDVAVIPPIGDQPTQTFTGAQGFFISAFSEQKLLAQTFLLDFIATDEVMQALYDADPRGTAWQAVQDGLSSDPQVATFAEAANNGIPMPNVPEMASVWGPLGDNMLLIRNGEIAAADAMTTAAEAVRSAIAGG
ncbi:MAG: maltose ABC transporter substrate-binding protein [Actinobacteria bacterium]|nr:maltose ABC transporter substrate-binding protein [Actinomycetota bacterium]